VTLPELLKAIDQERKLLNAAQGEQLHSERHRAKLRALAENYFHMRHAIVSLDTSMEAALSASDEAMQQVILLSHKRCRVSRYKQLLNVAKNNLAKVDGHLISTRASADSDRRSEVDKHIIETLNALVPSAALSYEQALHDLDEAERLSWRGPATDLREALRELLDHLAPDNDVVRSPWYKQEKDTHGPTMRQKVRYVLSNRGTSRTNSTPAEEATSAVDELIGKFVRSVYTRSSISTHTPTDKTEVLRVLSLVRVVLGELLEVR
jgi:hypothetical protein